MTEESLPGGTPGTPSGPRPAPASHPEARARIKPPVPASAAWLPGMPAGRRNFAQIGGLALENDGLLPGVVMSYETFGERNAAGDNCVLVLHALTGDSHVAGGAGPGHPTPGWWDAMIGPGKPIDTNRFYVVVPNVLGGCQGSTGPAWTAPDGQPWGGRFPRLTTRDQVAAEILLAKHLGIECFELVIGASLGGLRALEWAIMGPEAGITVTRLAAIATTAATSADQIAWAHPQLAAIRLDPGYCDGNYYGQPDNAGPHRGLEIARQIAHTTYRSAAEMDARFGRLPQGGEDVFTDGRFAVQSYLDHHGDKLARRFDANSYLVLTESMLTHDIGRDRGGVEAALASIQARALVVGVDSDRLFPLTQSARIAQGIPACDALATIHTPYGHDGFLIEFPQLAPLIAHFLAQTPVSHPSYA